MNSVKIPLNKIHPNTGQIEGLPRNPRFIRDARFEALKKSIADAPEMLELRELIVFPHPEKRGHFVTIAGNMRYRAIKESGELEAHCKPLSKNTPVEKLAEIAIKDNIGFGQDDYDVLANEWDSLFPLAEWGMELPTNGHEESITSSELTDGLEYRIIVKCSDEQHQQELLERFISEELECQALIS